MAFDSIPVLIEGLRRGDWRALSRAITLAEAGGPEASPLLDYAYHAAREACLVLGLTGAGGAGKSTLISQIIRAYRARGLRVCVLAVDPSSPYTGGALLGDRIRMGTHSRDSEVFIRSLASRGGLGGISQGTKGALYLCRAFGFEVILLETLGTGQDETDVSCFADVTLVVLAPGNGDSIQLSKAGTQEIADVFVVNKGDKPEAETLYQQLCAAVAFLPESRRPLVVKAAAAQGQGIEELLTAVEACRVRSMPQRQAKVRARLKNEVLTGVLSRLAARLEPLAGPVLERLYRGELTPSQAIALLEADIRLTDIPATPGCLPRRDGDTEGHA